MQSVCRKCVPCIWHFACATSYISWRHVRWLGGLPMIPSTRSGLSLATWRCLALEDANCPLQRLEQVQSAQGIAPSHTHWTCRVNGRFFCCWCAVLLKSSHSWKRTRTREEFPHVFCVSGQQISEYHDFFCSKFIVGRVWVMLQHTDLRSQFGKYDWSLVAKGIPSPQATKPRKIRARAEAAVRPVEMVAKVGSVRCRSRTAVSDGFCLGVL